MGQARIKLQKLRWSQAILLGCSFHKELNYNPHKVAPPRWYATFPTGHQHPIAFRTRHAAVDAALQRLGVIERVNYRDGNRYQEVRA